MCGDLAPIVPCTWQEQAKQAFGISGLAKGVRKTFRNQQEETTATVPKLPGRKRKVVGVRAQWLEFTRVPVVAPAGTVPGYRLCEAPSQSARDRTFNDGWRDIKQ